MLTACVHEQFCYLGGEVAAELELLQRDRHGVGAKEKDEGHEGQVGDEFAGLSHQRASILHALLLAQLTPVQSCDIQLGWWAAVLGRQEKATNEVFWQRHEQSKYVSTGRKLETTEKNWTAAGSTARNKQRRIRGEQSHFCRNEAMLGLALF